MAVETTVEVVERMMGKKMQKITITRHVGLATYVEHGREFEAELATFIDCGKYGVTRCYTPPREKVSEEERQRNRARILETAASILMDKGLW